MEITATNDTSKATTVTLNGNTANISAGGNGTSGSIRLTDASGKTLVELYAPPANVATSTVFGSTIGQPAGPALNVLVNAAAGVVALGDGKATGPVILIDGAGHLLRMSDGATTRVDVDAAKATLSLNDAAGKGRIELDGATGNVALRADTGKDRIVFNAGMAYAGLGGNGCDGALGILPAGATNLTDGSQCSIFMNGKTAVLTVAPNVWIDGKNAIVHVGGAQKDGSIVLASKNGQNSIQLDASTGDITLFNADCAEDFDVAEDEGCQIEAGTVVVLDDEGRIRSSTEPYDSKVAGVLSGAGGLRPGLVLDRTSATRLRRPVALMGKVFCKVDAQYAPIRTGDLLTTSLTCGHAMKMTDRARGLGAVLGKALRPVGAGRTLIPILVTLQ